MRVRVAVVESLLAASAQLVREPPLPMLAGRQFSTPWRMRSDRQFMLRPRSGLTQDDAGERRAELPSGVAAHDRG
jgi:hypothetical protein